MSITTTRTVILINPIVVIQIKIVVVIVIIIVVLIITIITMTVIVMLIIVVIRIMLVLVIITIVITMCMMITITMTTTTRHQGPLCLQGWQWLNTPNADSDSTPQMLLSGVKPREACKRRTKQLWEDKPSYPPSAEETRTPKTIQRKTSQWKPKKVRRGEVRWGIQEQP